MSEGDKLAYFGYGFLAGALAGAAIGLLFAPKSGKETRAMIAEKSEKLVDDARETWDKAKEKVSSLAHQEETKGRKA